MGSFTYGSSGKLNLKTERVISHKHLIYRKRKQPSINEPPPRASPHPQDNEVCAWTVASYFLFAPNPQ